MTALAIPVRIAPPAFPIPTRRHVYDVLLEGLNPNTLRAYSGAIRHLAAYLGVEDPYQAVDGLLSLTRGEANAIVLGYRAHMLDGGLSGSTVKLRLAAVRKLVEIARIVGDVEWTLEVPAPRVESLRDTRGPGKDGWEAMLRVVRGKAAEGGVFAIRDLAMVLTLHDNGLRRGELCSLDYEGLDQHSGVLWVVGKGRTQAKLHTLNKRTTHALAGWLAVRGTDPGPLFTRLDNAGSGTGRLTGESVRKVVRDLGREAGVGRVVRPHGLRHQAITGALEKGHSIVEVMKFARHASPTTTMIYDDNRADVAGMVARSIAGEE